MKFHTVEDLEMLGQSDQKFCSHNDLPPGICAPLDSAIDGKCNTKIGGRDSVVIRATLYGMDGPGIESRWEPDFPQQSIPGLGPTQLPVQWVPGLFPGGKAAGT
jgi:hypothetical protein